MTTSKRTIAFFSSKDRTMAYTEYDYRGRKPLSSELLLFTIETTWEQAKEYKRIIFDAIKKDTSF